MVPSCLDSPESTEPSFFVIQFTLRMLPGHHTIQLPQLEISHFLWNLWGKTFSQRYILWLISPVRRDESVLCSDWSELDHQTSHWLTPGTGWAEGDNLHKKTLLVLAWPGQINHHKAKDWPASLDFTAYISLPGEHLLSLRAAHSQLPSWERNPDKHVVQIFSRWLQTTG